MKNKITGPEKAEKLYLLAHEVADHFLGMFPNEQLSRVFTDSVYEELEDDTSDITKTQLHSAAAIVIKEIIEKNELTDRALKDIKRLLTDANNALV